VIRRALLLLLLLPATARGADVIGWQDAPKHVGETATVEGTIAAVHCSPLACSLAFDPTFRVTAIIQAERFDVFPPSELEGRYKGQRVRATGPIDTIDGKARIQVANPEALAVVRPERRPDATTAAREDTGDTAVGAAQTEVLDRLGDIVERLEALSERLAAAEERMASLMGYLDQREQSFAAAPMSPLTEPPALRPAPAAQALRSLKRGMSIADFERLAGSPVRVIDSGNGWQTWDYGGGRVVTFDNRGRAQSLTGFGGS